MKIEKLEITAGALWSCTAMTVLIFMLFYLFTRNINTRNVRCNTVCETLNSKAIACESGVTVCANNKIVWRKLGQS